MKIFLRTLYAIILILISTNLFTAIPTEPKLTCEGFFEASVSKCNDTLITHLANVFKEKSVKYAVIGGYSMLIHGIQRQPTDIDIIIPRTRGSFNHLQDVMTSIGFRSSLPIELNMKLDEHAGFNPESSLDFDFEVRSRGSTHLWDRSSLSLQTKKHSNMIYDFISSQKFRKSFLVWEFYKIDNPGIIVDVIATFDLSQLSTVNKTFRNTEIVVVSKEDLIYLKKTSPIVRDKDLRDIEMLKKSR